MIFIGALCCEGQYGFCMLSVLILIDMSLFNLLTTKINLNCM